MKKALLLIVFVSYIFATEKQATEDGYDLAQAGIAVFKLTKMHKQLGEPFSSPPKNVNEFNNGGHHGGIAYYENLAVASAIVSSVLDEFIRKNKNKSIDASKMMTEILFGFEEDFIKQHAGLTFWDTLKNINKEVYDIVHTDFYKNTKAPTGSCDTHLIPNGAVKKCKNGMFYRFDGENFVAGFPGYFDISVQNEHIRQTAPSITIYDSRNGTICGKTYKIKKIALDKFLIQ